MRKILSFIAASVLGTVLSYGQLIWHPNLGAPYMGVVNIPWNTTTYVVPCCPEETTGFLTGVVESLNSQLAAAGIGWVEVDCIESGDDSETYEVVLSLLANNTTSPRTVNFGTSSRTFSITQQIQGWSGDPGYSGNGPMVLINDPDTTVWVPPLTTADVHIVMGTYQEVYTLYRLPEGGGGSPSVVHTFSCHGPDMHYIRYLQPGKYRFSFQDQDDCFYVRIPEFLGWAYGFDGWQSTVDSTAHNITVYSDTVTSPSGQYYALEENNYKLPHLQDVEYALNHRHPAYWPEGWSISGDMDEDGGITLVVHIPENTDTTTLVGSFPDTMGTGWHFRITQTGRAHVPVPDPDPGHYGPNPDAEADDTPTYRKDLDTFILQCPNSIVSHSWNGGYSPEASDVTYYDGLGYPSLELSLGAGGTVGGSGSFARTDILRPYAYDHLLREDRMYLPYARAASTRPSQATLSAWKALADTTAYASQDAWYAAAYPQQMADTSFAWTDMTLESAVSGRILSNMKPGPDYRHALKKARTRYRGNDSLEVRLLSVNPTSGALSLSGYYAPGSLSVIVGTDEDGGQLRTYNDREGRPVLERRLIYGDPSDTTSTCTWADTYYVYDWAGRLAWVVTPEGSARLAASLPAAWDGTFAQRYCYYYAYDNRGNVALRTAPGVGAEHMEYDACGRLIRRQDAVMAQEGRYVAYGYDTAGRLTRETLRSEAPAATDSTVLRMYRYDTYPAALADSLEFKGITGITTGLSSRSSSTAGLLTWEKVNVLGTSGYVERAYHYDSRGNVIQVAELDPNGRVLRRSSARDLAGNVTATYDSYFRPGKGDPDRIRTQYSYDSRGRKLSVARTVNGETLCTVTYSYDALGRLALKEASSAGFSESHTYDCRGWITGSAASASGTGVFSEGLRYADPQKDTTLRRFGGGISESAVTHNGTTQGPTETYAYSYDRAGRLTGADYYAGTDVTPSDENTEKDIAYDLSGGITALKRYSLAGLSNDLHFTLDGARLVAVTDSSAVSPTSKSLTYDANGALTSDARLGISVTNNILGLPSLITQGTRSVTLTYLADGTRTAMADAMGVAFRYAGPFVYGTERVFSGGHSSLKENLHSIAWDEGRISYVEEGGGGLLLGGGSIGEAALPDALDPGLPPIGDQRVLRDEWHVRDHLGSTRVVYNLSAASGTTVASRILEKDDYLPFGQRRFGPTNSSNRWRFSGKEEMSVSLTELGILDFGARYYDPGSAHWLSPDPLREKYYGINPYTYCAGDPIRFADIGGATLLDKVVGFFLGVVSNAIPGAGHIRDSYTPTNPADYNNGLKAADATSVLTETAMISAGMSSMEAGAGMAVAGAAVSATGVGAPAGGPAMAIGGVSAAGGAALTASGAIMLANTAKNASDGYQRGGGSESNNTDGYVTFIQGTGKDAKKVTTKIPDGYRKINERMGNHAKIFTNGKDYISPDLDDHNGGIWKRGRTIKALKSNKTRMGTYDADLNRIGD